MFSRAKVNIVKWLCQHKYVLFMSQRFLNCQSDSIIELPFLFHFKTSLRVLKRTPKHTYKHRMSNTEIMVKKIIIQVLIKKKKYKSISFYSINICNSFNWTQFFLKTYIMHSSFIHRFVNSWSCDH